MKEILEDIRQFQEKKKKDYAKTKSMCDKLKDRYLEIINSTKASPEKRKIASNRLLSEIRYLERCNEGLIQNNFLMMLGLTIEEINLKLRITMEELNKSGIMENMKELGDLAELKKQLNESAKLMKKLSDAQKEMIEESNKEHPYIC